MSRRGPAKRRKTEEDVIYGNKLVAKLISQSQKDGKKTAASKQVYCAFEILKKKDQDPLAIFSQALDNIRPQMEVRPRRIGGAAYQVPASVRGPRKDSLAIRWLIQSSRARSSKEYHTFGEKLAAEILEAYAGAGGAVKKKENMHRMAEANKAFAHFRW